MGFGVWGLGFRGWGLGFLRPERLAWRYLLGGPVVPFTCSLFFCFFLLGPLKKHEPKKGVNIIFHGYCATKTIAGCGESTLILMADLGIQYLGVLVCGIF